jgi:ABC-type bacteriocin/lantibiotic exporter with double-glycine peptidase domain
MKSKINKTLSLLTKKNKINILFIVFLSIIKTAIELIGIGLLIPLLAFISSAEKKILILDYLPYLKVFSDNEVILIFIAFFIFIYLCKTLYVIFYNIYNTKFVQNLYVEMSSKLLEKYLKNNYIFFIENNSARLIRNIVYETSLLSSGVIYNVINLLSNLILFIGICSVLTIYNYHTILVILILLIVCAIVAKTSNNRFVKWGKIRISESIKLNQKLNEVFGSIKEAILYDKADFFMKQVVDPLRKSANAVVYKDVHTSITSPIIEFTGIFIFFSFFLFLVFFLKMEFSEIFVTLGIFAFACIRLLPNLMSIVRVYQNIKFNFPVIDNTYNQLTQNINQNKKNIKIDEINQIKFDKVNFIYPGQSTSIFKDISLNFKAGDKIGIIGETGSGKTTLINLISGLLIPTKGKININSSNKFDFEKQKLNIGYVSQSVYLSDDNIIFNISLTKKNSKQDLAKIKNLLDILNLNNFRNRGIKTSIGERGSKMSGGQIQRIGIARALFRDSSLLILDEGTNALDEKTENKILKYIFSKFQKKIVIICTHKKKLLKYCNKIVEVKEGRVKLIKNN